MNDSTRAEIGRALNGSVAACAPLGGGDINEAFQVTLHDGRRVFAKIHRGAPPGFFQAEASGLDWLAQANALRLPQVLGIGGARAGAEAGATPFLLLEWIEPAVRSANFDETLGVGLAVLHRTGASAFGFERDNFVAVLPQDNRHAPTWAVFYRERRLAPLFDRARERGFWDRALDPMSERLLSELERLAGPDEPPARLHGDLWGGNLHVDEKGQPVLIDPAVYAGHREVDLAMMRLFGGFGERVFEAYAASYPLAPGYRERVALYQLYPLLVHLCSFGSGYLEQVKRCMARYV